MMFHFYYEPENFNLTENNNNLVLIFFYKNVQLQVSRKLFVIKHSR